MRFHGNLRRSRRWLGLASLTAICCMPGAGLRQEPNFTVPPVTTTHPAERLRLKSERPLSAEDAKLEQTYASNLASAPRDYASLAASLGDAPSSNPKFAVRNARFFNAVTRQLQLRDTQLNQLASSGAISVQLPYEPTMGGVYAALWQADMPVLITTDSILHAWHKTYDATLKRQEVTRFSAAYRDLLEGMARGLRTQLRAPSSALDTAARHLDLYLTVALTLLPPRVGENAPRLSEVVDENPPPAETPALVDRADVERIVQAVYAQRVTSVPVFGEIDFTQFKPRGHYTESDELARYFRAVMWMGRSDTGFDLSRPETSRVALIMGVLAAQSGSLPAFQQAQAAIDYFVGTSNGLSLVDVATVLKENGVTTLTELEDEARVRMLTEKLLAATPSSRVTSHGVLASGKPQPPPMVFQLSSQRFTLDSFVHQKVSFDRIATRTMVDGLDVFAAMGNSEATRLLQPQLEQYEYSGQMHALRTTIATLPPGYWQQNVYTRWFDALRTLDDIPEGPYLPDLFKTGIWQRKQLNNQLASWAELRRDTILYVAQVYAGVLCEFPDVYLEPYPAFYHRMHDMALEAQKRLNEPDAFRGFIDVMNKLSDIATRELTEEQRNEADRAYLKALVKARYSDGGCGGPDVTWSGWYMSLFPYADMFEFEPVIADVFTDPNAGRVLNVATTGPDLMVAAIQTQDGPTIFAGPVAGYRQFVGSRMTDSEWKAKVESGDIPPVAEWNTLHAGKGTLPAPHHR